MAAHTFSSAIVVTDSRRLRELVRSLLAQQGVPFVHTPTLAAECAELLASDPDAALVCEWSDVDGVARFALQAASEQIGLVLRPVLLLSSEAIESQAGMQADFLIEHAWIGELTEDKVAMALQSLQANLAEESEMRESVRNLWQSYRQSDWAKAKSRLERLCEKNDDLLLMLELCHCLLQIGNPEEALSLLETNAADTLNDQPRYFRLCGQCLVALHRYREAQTMLRQAVSLNPYSTLNLRLLAAVELKLKDYRAAISSYRELIALDDTDMEAQGGLSRALLLSGHMEEGFQRLQQFESKTTMVSHINAVAIDLARHHQYSPALELYRRSIELDELEPGLRSKLCYNLGLIWFRLGRHALARDCFAVAMSLNKDNRFAHDNWVSLNSQLDESGQAPDDPGLALHRLLAEAAWHEYPTSDQTEIRVQ